MENLIGLKDFRENMGKYADRVAKGNSYVVLKKTKPLFRISPINNHDQWEVVTDFTKIKKGGVEIDEILSRL